MAELTRHWTEKTTEDFLYRIAADFVRQLEIVMDHAGISRQELASLLSVTKGRVSQFLNNPGNMTMRNVIDYSRALGLKATILAYDDGDPTNANGPINAEVFTRCWEMFSKPRDAFDLAEREQHRIAYFEFRPLGVRSASTNYTMQQSHLPLIAVEQTAATTRTLPVPQSIQ